MNLHELPFDNVPDLTNVRGDTIPKNKILMVVKHGCNTICLNLNFECHVTYSKDIEIKTPELLTHETIHAVLNEIIGLKTSPEFDSIDSYWEISNIY